MTRYLIQRLFEVVPILLGLSVIMFALLAFAPGDPIDVMLSHAPQSVGVDIAALKRAYGLDQPVPVRYVRWLGRVVQGDLGWSIQDRMPVRTMLAERIPRSLLLMGSGLLLAIAVAVPVGIYAALRQYSIGDYAVSIVGFVGFSVPLFWMGLGLIYIFSIKLRWLPPGGYSSQAATGVASVPDLVRHLVLPMIVIAMYNMAATMRYTRSAMLEVIHQDYVRTARAKGLSESAVTVRHAARNALIPVVTVLALTLPALIGGAPVTESIFSWPGVGQLLVQSVVAGDLVVAQSVLMMLAAMVLVANILADIVYVLIDPRVRYD
jgi:peptide/nickel transport system permease protein